MASSLPEISGNYERIEPGRLVGWKEIASYLGKADRTVKRWGRDRGLPVHRVPGSTKTSVYAYPAELDRWLESVNSATSADDPEESSPESLSPVEYALSPTAAIKLSSRAPKRRWGLALVSVALAAGILYLGIRFTDAAGPFRRLLHPFASAGFPASPSAGSSRDQVSAGDLYLRGRYQWNQRTPESLHRALDLFQEAIQRNTTDARAYAGLADTYNLLPEYTTDRESDAFPHAIAAARRAVSLDPSLPEGHRALAYSEIYGNWNFAAADREFGRALELNPNDPQARRWYANALGLIGRFPEAIEQMEKAQELDPSSHPTLADKGLLLYDSGRRQEGLELLKEVERSVPGFRSPHFYLMRISLDLRDYPAYLAEGDLAAESAYDPVLKDMIAAARAGYMRGGGRGLLEALYTKQRRYYQAGSLRATTLAATCVLLGNRQEALEILEQAYHQHDSEILSILSHHDLVLLKEEPRYQALVRKISFPAGPPSARNIAGVSPQALGPPVL